MSTHTQQQKGFTLVELAIVLVIIGLIVSSVLVGQDLIKSAEVRATINQYSEFNAAAATFRVKYDGLPGDVGGTTRFGFQNIDNNASNTNVNGDEDGRLEGNSGLLELSNENMYFWNHLGSINSGLIGGRFSGTNAGPTNGSLLRDHMPEAKIGGFWGVFSDGSNNFYVLGTPALSATYDMNNNLDAISASSIDTKLDDGVPNTGTVTAGDGDGTLASRPGSMASGTSSAMGDNDDCVTQADIGMPSRYNTQSEGRLNCYLNLRLAI